MHKIFYHSIFLYNNYQDNISANLKVIRGNTCLSFSFAQSWPSKYYRKCVICRIYFYISTDPFSILVRLKTEERNLRRNGVIKNARLKWRRPTIFFQIHWSRFQSRQIRVISNNGYFKLLLKPHVYSVIYRNKSQRERERDTEFLSTYDYFFSSLFSLPHYAFTIGIRLMIY